MYPLKDMFSLKNNLCSEWLKEKIWYNKLYHIFGELFLN